MVWAKNTPHSGPRALGVFLVVHEYAGDDRRMYTAAGVGAFMSWSCRPPQAAT